MATKRDVPTDSVAGARPDGTQRRDARRGAVSNPADAVTGGACGRVLVVRSEDVARAQWLRGQVEAELLQVGGHELVDDARREAEWYVALFFPCDKRDNEPPERLASHLEILTARLNRGWLPAGGQRRPLPDLPGLPARDARRRSPPAGTTRTTGDRVRPNLAFGQMNGLRRQGTLEGPGRANQRT